MSAYIDNASGRLMSAMRIKLRLLILLPKLAD